MSIFFLSCWFHWSEWVLSIRKEKK